jgi:hypothetical protein
MPFWGGLNQGLQNFQQGQNNAQQFQQRAMQIQQAQSVIDDQKRQLAAQAAAFSGLTGGQQGGVAPPPPQSGGMPGQPQMPSPGPQTGQPPMPGQSSMPAQGMPNQGAPPSGVQSPVQGPMAPQAGGQSPMPGGGLGGQDLSPQGQMSIIAQIAQTIKSRNPTLDSQTLFEAVKQQIGLLGALSSTQKQQLVLAADQLKADTSRANTQDRVGAQRDIATDRNETSRANTQDRVRAQIQATSARIADADQRLNQTQAAINARQDKSLSGKVANKAQSERAAYLRTQLSQAKQKLSAAGMSMNQTQIDTAQKGVDDAYARVLDFQKKAGAGEQAPQAGPAPTGGGATRGPAPATLHGKSIYPENGKWVYEDGTEAK